jgi:hypothetical protein
MARRQGMSNKWKLHHTLGIVALVVAIVLCSLLIPISQVIYIWLACYVGLVLFIMVVGSGMTGRFWLGWAVNEQNRASLSRVQMLLWTSTVLSGWLCSVIFNLRIGNASQELDAVNVGIPSELWLAMGISTASLVGSPLVLAARKMTLVARNAAKNPPPIVLNAKSGAAEARLSDLFTGEEASNGSALDISRLQNILFTLVLVVVYAVSLGNLMVSADADLTKPITALPSLSIGAAALLGITNAGYLVGKGSDKP